MKFTYYGHASFELETGGKKLLFDPFISHNELAKHIDVNSLKPDYILLSHGHGDHVADLFDMQDEIVSRLANTLNAELIKAEARRAERSFL